MDPYRVYSCTRLLSFSKCSWYSSILLCVWVIVPLCTKWLRGGRENINSFIHSLVGRHLGCHPFWSPSNRILVNILMQFSLWTFTSLRWTPMSGINGLVLSENVRPFFPRGGTILHAHQQYPHLCHLVLSVLVLAISVTVIVPHWSFIFHFPDD